MKMLSLKNRKLIGGIVFVVAAAGAYMLLSGGGEVEVDNSVYVPQVKTMIVERGFDNSLVTTGEVYAEKSSDLTAGSSADVVSILVKPGDVVSKAQPLVTLYSDQVSAQLATATQSLGNAQSNLADTEVVADKSVEAARVALETAQLNLKNTEATDKASRTQAIAALNSAKLNQDLSTDSAETQLDTAEKSLEKAQILAESTEATAQSALNSAIASAYATANTAIDICDEAIGVSDYYKNLKQDADFLIGVTAADEKKAAIKAIEDALKKLEIGVDTYDEALELIELTITATKNTSDVFRGSIASDGILSITQINAYISAANAQLVAAEGAKASLISSNANYEQTIVSNESTLLNAEQAVKSAKNALDQAEQNVNGYSQTLINAEAQYDATIASLDSALDAARKALESSQTAYDSAAKSAELSVLGAKSSLTGTEGEYNIRQIQYNDLTIKAPFTGVVSSVEVDEGDEVAAGTPIVRVENSSSLKIIAYLSSKEVEKVKVGDEVEIEGDGVDVIDNIAPSADPQSKKYKVEIVHEDDQLKPGEFVRLTFRLASSNTGNGDDSKIFLPITSINIEATESYVWLVEDGKVVKRIVEIGGIEGSLVEIKSGIEEGEEVVTEGGRVLEYDDDGTQIEVIS